MGPCETQPPGGSGATTPATRARRPRPISSPMEKSDLLALLLVAASAVSALTYAALHRSETLLNLATCQVFPVSFEVWISPAWPRK